MEWSLREANWENKSKIGSETKLKPLTDGMGVELPHSWDNDTTHYVVLSSYECRSTLPFRLRRVYNLYVKSDLEKSQNAV